MVYRNLINPILYFDDFGLQDIMRNSSSIGLINPIYYANELWVNLLNVFEDVLPVYWVSNYGRVYSENIKAIMKPSKVMKPKYRGIPNMFYYAVDVHFTDGSIHKIGIHRLMLLAFEYRLDCDKLVSNHINGIKTFNYLPNLEWTDYSGNNQHAYDTGLKKCGEDNNFSKYNEKDIRSICKLLQYDVPHHEIAMRVFGTWNESIDSLIRCIRNGTNWKQVSREYAIPNRRDSRQKFTEDQIHEICKMLESDNTLTAREILLKMNYADLDSMNTSDRMKLFEIVNRIKRRERFTRISENYKF